MSETQREQWREEVKGAIERQGADIAAIKRAVIGDQEYQQPGLLSRMNKIEGWRRNLDLRIAYIGGGAAVIVFLVEKLFKN